MGSRGYWVSQTLQRSAVAGTSPAPFVRRSASMPGLAPHAIAQVAEASQGRHPQPLSMRSGTHCPTPSWPDYTKDSSPEDGSFGGRGDARGIAGEHALRVPPRWRHDVVQPGGDLVVGEEDAQLARFDVELDRVAVAQRGDRPAPRGFGGDVPDHQAVGRARETAVRDQSHFVAEALADERGRDVQHLAHPGPACWALVTDDDDVTGLDAPRFHGREALVLGIEDARRTGVEEALVPGELHDTALRREVAAQDREPARRLEGSLDRDDHLLAGCL